MNTLLSARPRLIPDECAAGARRDLAAHQSAHGRLDLSAYPSDLIAEVAASGLTGRGGAGFPTARKLSAVAAGTAPVVVANAAEGEPASSKDKALLSLSPHLVLDGLQVACRAVGSSEAYVYVHEGPLLALMSSLVTMRAGAGVDAVRPTVVAAPARFLSGQESAVVSRINGGRAIPSAVPPPVYERGVARRPTLVQNVETLAHLALVAGRGASWFRAQGTSDEPGSMLCTLGGGVRHRGVVEVPIGTHLGEVIDRAGGASQTLQAVLVGGYHGTWVPAAEAMDLPLSLAGLRPAGAMPGAGVVVALPSATCGLVETARVVGYLADQSARQCGPCLNGLPSLAQALLGLARCDRTHGLPDRVRQLTGLVEGRGACHHPDGTTRFVRSALTVLAAEVEAHLSGRCTATDASPVLPVPTREGRTS